MWPLLYALTTFDHSVSTVRCAAVPNDPCPTISNQLQFYFSLQGRYHNDKLAYRQWRNDLERLLQAVQTLHGGSGPRFHATDVLIYLGNY